MELIYKTNAGYFVRSPNERAFVRLTLRRGSDKELVTCYRFRWATKGVYFYKLDLGAFRAQHGPGVWWAGKFKIEV